MQKGLCVSKRLWLFAAVLSLALGPVSTLAQSSGGTISGVVTDTTGATVPGASVAVKNLATNATKSVTTEADGRYSFPNLPIGQYELTVSMSGFGTHVRGPIGLTVNQNAVINVELSPAAVAETVTVTDDASILNTTNAEVGVRFDERRISDLPLNGSGFRDVFSLALSAPGVSQTNAGNSAFASGVNFSANGMRLRSNNFTIDGQDSNDPSVTGRQQVINNPDIVKEFRLVTNQFDAEHGRAAGAVVQVITKSGSNDFHGSGFWFYNGQGLNALTNLDKSAGFTSAPFRDEDQYGGTIGGPIFRDHTWGFGSFQRWTIRSLGSGSTIVGTPTTSGLQMLQTTVGALPQVQALLAHLPGAGTSTGMVSFVCPGSGPTTGTCPSGSTITIPTGSLTNSAAPFQTNTQWTSRIDQRITQNHDLFGRFMFSDTTSGGAGQATPPGLTTVNDSRTMAMVVNLNSTLSPKLLNVLQLSWQRLSTNTSASDPNSETIPSIEINQLGLVGFNAAAARTAIGLAVNLPQFRFNNTYQIQETVSLTRGAHAMKFGIDFRRVDVQSFFFPTIRGRLAYSTLQDYIDDRAQVATINKPLPGGAAINNYRWYDYYFFVQDTWQIHPTLSLNYGIRYETPGNTLDSLIKLNQSILATNGNRNVFLLNPTPDRDLNNWQPRFGFSWNPRTRNEGWIGLLTGGDQFVVRGGYSRTNDYQFLNIALNVASSFPFVAAINLSGTALTGAFTSLPNATANLSNDASLNLLTRTVVANDFRSPLAEQYALEVQRSFKRDYSLRIGYVGTKGTALFQTVDGNPRTQCNPVSATFNYNTPTTGPLAGMFRLASISIPGCPRVNTAAGVIRLRANAASSIYHSMQVQLDKRFSNGFSAGMHYTWSAFIDDASEIFNPSTAGEVAVSQNSFDRRSDRGRSTYDRPHRLSTNAVWELPWYRSQQGILGHVAGGWQIGGFATFQSGSPFSALNGVDPTAVLSGIDGLVGNSIRPDAPTANVSGMTLPQLLAAGGSSLFPAVLDPRVLSTAQQLALVGNQYCAVSAVPAPAATATASGTCNVAIPLRYGTAGRNILRSDGIGNIDLSILKTTNVTEVHKVQFRVDFLNLTNTRNFGIPEARINNSGFARQWSTNGGSRSIYLSLKYLF